jgi:hypothetical protein
MPPAFTGDSDRLSRFEREARVRIADATIEILRRGAGGAR